jgi:hypothetical protein
MMASFNWQNQKIAKKLQRRVLRDPQEILELQDQLVLKVPPDLAAAGAQQAQQVRMAS